MVTTQYEFCPSARLYLHFNKKTGIDILGMFASFFFADMQICSTYTPKLTFKMEKKVETLNNPQILINFWNSLCKQMIFYALSLLYEKNGYEILKIQFVLIKRAERAYYNVDPFAPLIAL